MPVAYIDILSGLTPSVKAQLVKEVAESIHNAYPIPDTRVFLREFAAEQTSIDGVLVSRVTSAIARACDLRAEVVSLPSGKRVSTRWVLSFFREVPLEQAALDDLMAFENPMVLESLEGKRRRSASPRSVVPLVRRHHHR